jgi:Na+/H+ antiporter NhaD/arsenite permease-like protein
MTGMQIFAASCFALAVIHTFATKYFEALSKIHKKEYYSGILHLLGEIEVVFGFWAMIFIIGHLFIMGKQPTIAYLESRVFTEPMFVFVIMIIAGSRPILYFAKKLVNFIAKCLPIPSSIGLFFLSLFFLPLMGSFITEPAAMTLSALILSERYFSHGLSDKLKYITIAVLFVNVSIGGAMTAYAAPPVLMVASKWNWDFAFMLAHFSWRAALAVFVNALLISFIYRKELIAVTLREKDAQGGLSDVDKIHPGVVATALLFLFGVVFFSHHITIFMGLFLFFLGFTEAFRKAFGQRLILREGLLVAFFLAGLVVLGGQQAWWIEPILTNLSSDHIFYVAIVLTAFIDNAALTYLASLVPDLSESFKYAVVAGALTGGGLTIIANAPNPAGFAILKKYFSFGAINPIRLLGAALVPTLIAMACFKFL